MELQTSLDLYHIHRQRVHHIVTSYQLDQGDSSLCAAYVDDLLQSYPAPLLELALAETLVKEWLQLPQMRGVPFFQKTHQQLQTWEISPIVSTLTPGHFYGITGLDPQPVFGSCNCPVPCP
ncbi:hypothetical protein [Prochlorothrix hollandica]|uniref:Uncharacterized protein n=1 Tax=Prochlorothrix hollandica PCC 9006 = CALU 1027 TaxID=317619 RepID=A0A0M2Q288_PROHO|nr:hypothetical protein [Prochlorothrix hollandica]KKJ01094.1 hypothetical protein PROH_01445 [Prochlorothrix hollandica PCC 9006 = CALU 1027]